MGLFLKYQHKQGSLTGVDPITSCTRTVTLHSAGDTGAAAEPSCPEDAAVAEKGVRAHVAPER